jgi:hypothetical protein
MATRAKPALRTSLKKAGMPKATGAARSRSAAGAAQTPSAEELDLRDRLKAGPRRPAGPPLAEDALPRGALDAARDAVLPPATNPKLRRARK